MKNDVRESNKRLDDDPTDGESGFRHLTIRGRIREVGEVVLNNKIRSNETLNGLERYTHTQ